MKWYSSLAATLIFALHAPESSAATYYVADCYKQGTVADAACVAGNDTTNNGLSAATPFKTLAKAASMFNTCAAGDKILHARGGAWFEHYTSGPTLRCTATTKGKTADGAPGTAPAGTVYVGPYTPSWGPGTAKPIFVSPTADNMFDFHSNGSAPATNGGYVIDGIELRGRSIYTTVSSATATTATLGATLAAGEYVGCNAHIMDGTGASGSVRGITANTTSTITVSDWPAGTPNATSKITLECGLWALAVNRPADGITFKNMTVDGFNIGLNCYGGNAADGDGAMQSYRIYLRNSTIKNSLSQGTLYSCLHGLMEDNTFDKSGGTGSQPDRDHPVYVSFHTPVGEKTNFMFRRNTITNLQGFYTTCATVAIVGHGEIDEAWFVDNYIYQAPNSANGGCWGIAIDPAYAAGAGAESFKRLVFRGNRVINVGGIGIGCTSCVAPVIENNVIISEDGPDLVAIAVPTRDKGAEDAATTGAKIRFNTIRFNSTKAYHQGIGFTQASGDQGTNHEVVGNIIHMGTAADSNHRCFDTTGLTIGNFVAFNYNICYDQSGNGQVDLRGTPIDSNRLTTDPLFVATPALPNSFAAGLQSSSPGVTSPAPNTYAPKLDRKGCQRGTSVHRGAEQYFASACTVAPQTPVGFH